MTEVVDEQVQFLHGLVNGISNQQRMQNVLRQHHRPLNHIIQIVFFFLYALFLPLGRVAGWIASWVASRVQLLSPLADRHLTETVFV